MSQHCVKRHGEKAGKSLTGGMNCVDATVNKAAKVRRTQ